MTVRLVGAGYTRKVAAGILGRDLERKELQAIMRALERFVPPYYNERQRIDLCLPDKLWKQEDAEPFVRVYVKQKKEEWDNR